MPAPPPPAVFFALTNLVAGDFVILERVYRATYGIRKGTVDNVDYYIGYVTGPASVGDITTCTLLGDINPFLSGLVPGAIYYADPTVPGGITTVAPVGTNSIQIVGKAINTNTLDTGYSRVIVGTGPTGLPPSGPAGGDLTGTYPNPGVNWANGLPVYDLQYYPLVTNPAGYIDATALTPYLTIVSAAATYYPLTNPAGYISSITALDVTTALGYIPYDSANPAGYITSAALVGYLTAATAAATYTPLTRNLTINGTTQDLSADRTWSVGTVTSVSGTGTVSGLTLSGTVTGSGNITLGGTLTLTSLEITTALGYTPYDAANPAGYINATALAPYLTSATAASTYVELAGDTMTGQLNFSGTTHAGIRLNNLTTAQRVALTPTSGMLVLDTDLDEFCHYNGAGWEYELNKAVTTLVTTTANTGTNITGLSFPLEANSLFLLQGYYSVACSGNGGLRFTQTVPGGTAMDILYDGLASAVTSSVKVRALASGILTTTAVNTVASNSGVIVTGYVRTTVSSGTLQMQFASGTSGQTSTVAVNSWIRLTRIS